MKKEWWIVGGTGLACAGIWLTLLFTIFVDDETAESSMSAEADSELTAFFTEEFKEETDMEQQEPPLTEEKDINEPEEFAEENAEDAYTVEAPVEIENLNLERIQEDGLAVNDVKLISPDQTMSIDEILEVLVELEDQIEEVNE
ncbi:hypothetical protein [Alkalicoccus daliensis]|uniref:Uncharacterized protein n=1 Tax=Alkalicoccus daliensis TaxID=745820 RepID=A0A1H0CAU6_9BACI|nr:hypothetical protein [Alkalicoccus daliensis]SDN54911.1 hypothetical protein SAMN04488053_10223 [Alkalicoccus daliensis]